MLKRADWLALQSKRPQKPLQLAFWFYAWPPVKRKIAHKERAR